MKFFAVRPEGTEKATLGIYVNHQWVAIDLEDQEVTELIRLLKVCLDASQQK